MTPDVALVSSIEARGVRKEYAHRSWFASARTVLALDQVDFVIERGVIRGLAGASGSGKSTLARCLAGLEPPTQGTIRFRGAGLEDSPAFRPGHWYRHAQLVFQDPSSTLNPRFAAWQAVAEPLAIRGVGNAACRAQALYWMDTLGIGTAAAGRPTLEFSGGERQRLAIARALITDPDFIIFDESFSGLDMPVRARVLDLLTGLQRERRSGYLLISHDLDLLARVCDEIAVMFEGRIVEIAPRAVLLANPIHEYTQRLVRAIPRRLSEGYP